MMSFMVKPSRKAERMHWEAGHQTVAGIDEVGRGAWAGPVVAAVVVLPQRCQLAGVRDSKLLSALQRRQLARRIRQQALRIGIGWADNSIVDEAGLTAAVHHSALHALSQVGKIEQVILDGNHNYLKNSHRSQAIVKADQSSLCVAAASVIAKVARDQYMELLHQLDPVYNFASNKGYGSPVHLAALRSTGLSAYHRRRWRPVAASTQLEAQFLEMIGVN
jgi:ribonuclease HII